MVPDYGCRLSVINTRNVVRRQATFRTRTRERPDSRNWRSRREETASTLKRGALSHQHGRLGAPASLPARCIASGATFSGGRLAQTALVDSLGLCYGVVADREKKVALYCIRGEKLAGKDAGAPSEVHGPTPSTQAKGGQIAQHARSRNHSGRGQFSGPSQRNFFRFWLYKGPGHGMMLQWLFDQ